MSPPFKPTAHPDEPRYAERLMANAVKSKDLDSSPIGEEFQEFIDRQDPEKLRRIHWASKVAEAMIVVSDAWRALELLGKDDRSTAWETLPGEEEFIDALRRVAKEASQRFRVQTWATVAVLGPRGSGARS